MNDEESVRYVIESGGHHESIKVTCETWTKGAVWGSTIEQANRVTWIDGNFETSEEAALAALRVLVGEIDAALKVARATLLKAEQKGRAQRRGGSK